MTIWVNGREYGTAAEIAARLGSDVSVAMVRNWHQRDGLTAHRVGRTVYHPLDEAAAIEAAKRRTPRGRPRQLDAASVLTA
ncbi:hypothetical protein [Micromonospora sp. HUAS LYJ1]|uniref:hypothetical protein n=1 Tax=Micromonospora sp. HUAS LYJ1 TaxID=3061626 RepID=UPI002673814E|nr:hypothetical protein [Micromonospora sp. HUAS LYJ1]WKU03739.1 hypothetical protein Q2K16_23285 [Micromonospora sp. HUAS LYJ1]